MIQQTLVQNGFTDKEARIYLATLEGGEVTVGNLAAKTNLKRTTVYDMIDALVSRGILTMHKRRGIMRVSALPPQVLIERFRHALAAAENVLPTLMDMAYSSPLKPRIRFYEGIDGLKELLLEVNNAQPNPEAGMIFTDYDKMPREIFTFIRKLVPYRRASRNFLRIVVPSNARSIEVQQEEDRFHYAEHRIANFPTENNPIELTLFAGTKVGFLSFDPHELFGVIIDSRAIYHTLKNLFLLVWANAKPKVKNI